MHLMIWKKKSMKSVIHLSLAMVGLICLGCGQRASEPMTRVMGVVTLDGQPLPDAEVVFRPERGRSSVGKTDEQGRYELIFAGNEKGALAVKHQVFISTAIERDSDSTDPMIQKGRPESLPSRYNSKTTLMADLTNLKASKQDFDLTSAKTP